MILKNFSQKLFFYNLPVFLFSLLPLFLITGPFLSDLSVSLISLLFLIYCFKEKNFSYFNNKFFYFFIFFWIYLVANSLINNFNIDSLKISFFYFRYGVFVVAIAALLEFDHQFKKYFFYCIFFCFTILIFDGFYQFFFKENIFGWKTNSVYRLSSFFKDELILGSYISRLWPIFFALSIFCLNPKSKLFFLFILVFILSESLIFLSGERTAFFYINLSAIFIIVFSKKLFKLRLITLISSILTLIIISYFSPSAKQRIIDSTLEQMNLTNKNYEKQKQVYIFSKQHTHHYLTGLKMYLDNKILGVGVKNFRNFCNNEKYRISNLSCSTHPHNTYVQILAETGIVGFLFLIFVLFYFLKYIFIHFLSKLKKKYYFTDFEICILSGVIIYLWPFVPSGNVFNNWLNIILILNLPFLIWSKNLTKNKIKN